MSVRTYIVHSLWLESVIIMFYVDILWSIFHGKLIHICSTLYLSYTHIFLVILHCRRLQWSVLTGSNVITNKRRLLYFSKIANENVIDSLQNKIVKVMSKRKLLREVTGNEREIIFSIRSFRIFTRPVSGMEMILLTQQGLLDVRALLY